MFLDKTFKTERQQLERKQALLTLQTCPMAHTNGPAYGSAKWGATGEKLIVSTVHASLFWLLKLELIQVADPNLKYIF